MSIQEEKLAAIADAIREVDGTNEPIVADDFPDRIRAISPGVKSFNGRTGDVVPASGDYTAEDVGALPLSGGELSGELKAPSGLTLVYPNNQEYNESLYTGVSILPYLEIRGTNTTKTMKNVRFKRSGINGSFLDVLARDNDSTETNILPVWVPTIPTQDNYAASKYYVDENVRVYSNAGSHNGIFRGKNLGGSVTAAQYAAIAAGTFDDLFIGDYWVINYITWRIAAFDYYFGTDGAALNTHHVTIVPDAAFSNRQMNTTNITKGGYIGSQMYTANIASARAEFQNAFDASHILTHPFYLSSAVTNGKVTGSTNVNQAVVLMSERNVYGQTIMSSECNDGSGSSAWLTFERAQFPLFALAPEFINKAHTTYFLRDVVSDALFAIVNNYGVANSGSASATFGVRPHAEIHG